MAAKLKDNFDQIEIRCQNFVEKRSLRITERVIAIPLKNKSFYLLRLLLRTPNKSAS